MFKLFDKKSEAIKKDINTIISDNSRFDIKEAYNELRTNIAFSISKKDCKVICTTSALASEGKSTTTVNNAITFAKSGKKILLIDCDLRKPNIAKLLGLNNDKGFSDVLITDKEVKDVIHKEVYENLDVITSGKIPPNPVELISSEQMESVISQLRKDYDYIFIDTPPINVVTDSALISKYTDGVIIVVRQYSVDKNDVTEAVKKLQFIGAKILGFILNDVVSSKAGYGGYKYKYNYNYKYERYYQ